MVQASTSCETKESTNDKTSRLIDIAPVGSAERVLLEWLCTEIARDGGATVVTSLKDHFWPQSPKRLNALLVQSPIGKPRLLKFLEYYTPSIFDVDRNATPHWVILTDRSEATNPYIRLPPIDQSLHLHQNHNDASACKLRQKVVYILRRRQSRLNRRAQHHLHNHTESNHVNVHWLIRECPWELHFYLRAKDFYRQHYADYKSETSTTATVHAVMTVPWQELVLAPFLQFLLEHCGEDLHGDYEQRRVWLKTSSLDTTTLPGHQNLPNNTDSSSSSSSHPISSIQPNQLPLQSKEWLDTLIQSIIHLVQQDGAATVSLGLLLHRHESLKQLLGGRDLWLLYQQHQELFVTPDGVLTIFQRTSPDPTNRHVRLQWKSSSSSPSSTSAVISNGEILQPSKTTSKKRMKVDTVGLYSVTNSRCASAIANIILQSCQQLQWNITELTAIDMTASVGGMTLGLARAKTKFHKILAMEIDETRAQLCRENMRDHGIAEDQVQVLHTDSVEAIPTFPKQCCCVIIDPPWGGEYYKEYKDQPPLCLGPWTLEDVLVKISQSVSQCLVGLRLPITLKVEAFLDSLATNRGLQFERITIRKLQVQLFVVLKLVAHNNKEDGTPPPTTTTTSGTME